MTPATLSTGVCGKRKESWEGGSQCPTSWRPENEGKKEARARGACRLDPAITLLFNNFELELLVDV